jgi:hypothetical protein
MLVFFAAKLKLRRMFLDNHAGDPVILIFKTWRTDVKG